MKLYRKKVGPSQYLIARADGSIVGNATMTGVPGRDTYPWDASAGSKSLGSHATLRDAIDAIASKLAKEASR